MNIAAGVDMHDSVARMTIRGIVLALCVGLAGIQPTAAATPDARKARQFILDGVVRAAKIIQAHQMPAREIASRLRDELRTNFNVGAIASEVLGTRRHRITKEQLGNFIGELEELIVQTYTNRVLLFGPRVKSDISDIIKVTGTRRVGADQLIVRSQVNRSPADWIKIDWRVHQRGGRLLILDVEILGISQVRLYRAEFSAVMRRNGRGVEGLIAALRRKNRALRDR